MPLTAARVNDLIPVFVLQLYEEVILGDSRICHEDIEVAHDLFGLRYQGLDFILVGKIARQHVSALADLRRKGIQHLTPGTRQRHRRTLRP
jgi:hypothetical protein